MARSGNPSPSPPPGPEIDEDAKTVTGIAFGSTTSSIEYTTLVPGCIPVSGEPRLTRYRMAKQRLSRMRKGVRLLCVNGCRLDENADGKY